jgi:hypothetical protein
MDMKQQQNREDNCYENCMGTYDEISSYSMTEEKNQVTAQIYSQEIKTETIISLKASYTQRREEG